MADKDLPRTGPGWTQSRDALPTTRSNGRDGAGLIWGTSCLGNLYEALPEETKLATVREMIRHCPGPVAPDSAGKYGAGLALEVVGRCLRKLRVPLREAEPTFERGVWAHLQHDAERRISYDGIRPCYEQGCALLGAPYRPAPCRCMTPIRFWPPAAGWPTSWKRTGRCTNSSRRARCAIAEVLPLDWVMFACSLTVHTHPPELLEFCAAVDTVNSAGRVV